MPQLIIGIIVIAIIWGILVFLYSLSLFISVNLLVLADKILGAWTIIPPVLSWAFLGFVMGALLYFAIVESPKLNRPNAKPLLIGIVCIIIVFIPIIGPATGTGDFNKYYKMARENSLSIKDTIHNRIQNLSKSSKKPSSDSPSKKEYGRVNVSAANIRSGPSTNNPIISVLQRGEGFEILSSKDSWSKIRFGGKEGFLYNQLIQKTNIIRTPEFKVGYHQAANASIQKIRIVPGSTYISLYAEEGVLYAPSHQYGMYLYDRKLEKKYPLLSATIPYEKIIKRKTFDIIFDEIPKNLKKFDLIEGNCMGKCWTFKNIKLF